MASAVSYHSRSISFPFTSHSLDATTEDHLCRLRKSSQCESSSSSSSICNNQSEIKNLYQLINDIIVLPLYQQVLSNGEVHRDSIEAVLEGSLALLDICGVTIDAVSQMKESILELESSIRRRSGEAKFLSAYKVSRRKIIKLASKCLGNFKKVDTAHLEKDDQRLLFVVRILTEAQVICLSTMKSLLAFLSGSKAGRVRSIVAKLTLQSKLSSDLQVEANEVEKIDQRLSGLDAKNLSTDAKTLPSLQKQLEAMEMTINEIEDGLLLVSRCLVKTRVSLLNILNH